MPGFVGGQRGFIDFMAANIKYPDAARKKQVAGQAVAEFMVETDGSVSHVKLVKQLGYGLEEEVLRVLMLLPKWDPALNKKGEPMAVVLELPFSLTPPPLRPTDKPSTTKTGTKKPKQH